MLRLCSIRAALNLGLRRSKGTRRLGSESLGKLESKPTEAPEPVKIDEETIALLEKLSLVDCANRKSIRVLEDAIAFADKIHQVDTEGVEPMYTVLEDEHIVLREDIVDEGNCQKDILKNASVTEEDYFVAPPGNIPLKQRENLLHIDKEKH